MNGVSANVARKTTPPQRGLLLQRRGRGTARGSARCGRARAAPASSRADADREGEREEVDVEHASGRPDPHVYTPTNYRATRASGISSARYAFMSRQSSRCPMVRRARSPTTLRRRCRTPSSPPSISVLRTCASSSRTRTARSRRAAHGPLPAGHARGGARRASAGRSTSWCAACGSARRSPASASCCRGWSTLRAGTVASVANLPGWDDVPIARDPRRAARRAGGDRERRERRRRRRGLARRGERAARLRVRRARHRHRRRRRARRPAAPRRALPGRRGRVLPDDARAAARRRLGALPGGDGRRPGGARGGRSSCSATTRRPSDLFDAAKAGDAAAGGVADARRRSTSRWRIADIGALLDPEAVVFGGGVAMAQGESFLAPIRDLALRCVPGQAADRTVVAGRGRADPRRRAARARQGTRRMSGASAGTRSRHDAACGRGYARSSRYRRWRSARARREARGARRPGARARGRRIDRQDRARAQPVTGVAGPRAHAAGGGVRGRPAQHPQRPSRT